MIVMQFILFRKGRNNKVSVLIEFSNSLNYKLQTNIITVVIPFTRKKGIVMRFFFFFFVVVISYHILCICMYSMLCCIRSYSLLTFLLFQLTVILSSHRSLIPIPLLWVQFNDYMGMWLSKLWDLISDGGLVLTSHIHIHIHTYVHMMMQLSKDKVPLLEFLLFCILCLVWPFIHVISVLLRKERNERDNQKRRYGISWTANLVRRWQWPAAQRHCILMLNCLQIRLPVFSRDLSVNSVKFEERTISWVLCGFHFNSFYSSPFFSRVS